MREMTKLGKWGIEGFVIVSSILLAFAIDSWWDNQQDQKLAQRYLRALSTEMSTTLDDVTDYEQVLNRRIERVRTAFELFSTPRQIDATPGISPFQTLVPTLPYPIIRSALDDLTNSGGFQTIEAPMVRQSVARYQQRLDLFQQRQDTQQQFNNDQYLMFFTKHADLYSLSNQFERAGIALPETNIQFDYDELHQNRELLNILFLEIALNLQTNSAIAQLKETIVETLSLLGSVYDISLEPMHE